jgi:hypothetical protein
LFAPDKEMESKPANHWFHIPWQIVVAAFCLYWYWHPPAPNKAVLILTGITVVMALIEMSKVHKAVYLVLVICLMFIENRAINKERTDATAQEINRREEENKQFQSIADGIKSAIDNSDKEFTATMGRTNQVLSNITGGESYSVLIPMLVFQRPELEIPLAIQNRGTNILTGVSVTLYDAGVWMGATHQNVLRSVENRIYVGTLHPRERLVLSRQIRPEQFMHVDLDTGPEAGHFFRVFVYIAAQNFTCTEYLDFMRNAENNWVFKYKVYREAPLIGGKSKQPQLLEQVGWSADSNRPTAITRH